MAPPHTMNAPIQNEAGSGTRSTLQVRVQGLELVVQLFLLNHGVLELEVDAAQPRGGQAVARENGTHGVCSFKGLGAHGERRG